MSIPRRFSDLERQSTSIETMLRLIDKEELSILDLEEMKNPRNNLQEYQILRKIIACKIRREQLKKILYKKLNHLSSLEIRKLRKQLEELEE